jgi:hypothetical protein
VRQDFAEVESGALSMSGLIELGLDPRCLVTVRAADVESALRSTADALACDALGAVVLEVFGDPRQLDLVASRKLTLAAQASGVTALLLRLGAAPAASTAETRWIVRAAHSPPPCPQCLRRLGMPGARRCSTQSSSATVMARSGGGSWNGNVMSAFSLNRRRILSLWLPRLPIDHIQRQLSINSAAPGKIPSVVVAKNHNAILLSAVDDIAVRAGLDIGCRSPTRGRCARNSRCTTPTRPPTARRSTTSPTGVTVSRRWWRSIRRMDFFSTSPVAPICSAARQPCCARSRQR